jgi:hypothetical protein
MLMGASDSNGAPVGGQPTQLEMDGRSATIPSHLYDAYIVNLDGTSYLGDELLPGARRLINELRARSRAWRRWPS